MSGARTLARRARPRAVIGALARIAPAMSLLHAPVALVAALDGLWTLAAAALCAAIAPPAIALPARRIAAAPSDLRGVEALIAVALMYLIATALSAPVFRALGMAPLDALFEAASAMTTTGLSVAADAEAWPFAGHFLRAWLQWVAGLAFLAAALALALGPGAVARRIGAASIGDDDLLTSTRTRARALLELYAALTAVAALAAAALARDPLDGALLALTAISTAGFSPAADSLASESRALQAAVMLACLVGAISFPMLLGLRRDGARRLLRDPAVRLMAMMLLGGAAAVALVEAGSGGAEPARAAADAAVQAASALSTAGFSSAPVSDLAPASLLVLIALMVVGGDVGSTAGGLKATCAVAALAAIRLTLNRAQTPPGAVTHLRAFEHRFGGEEIAGIAALASVYALSAGALWFAFLAFGAPALPALFDTVSALSTAGLSAGAVGPETPAALKAATAAAMLLGRLEFFALLALLRPATWI